MAMHISGEFECKCGAIKDFGEDFILPDPPFEIKCDACDNVLIQSDEPDLSLPEEKK